MQEPVSAGGRQDQVLLQTEQPPKADNPASAFKQGILLMETGNWELSAVNFKDALHLAKTPTQTQKAAQYLAAVRLLQVSTAQIAHKNSACRWADCRQRLCVCKGPSLGIQGRPEDSSSKKAAFSAKSSHPCFCRKVEV